METHTPTTRACTICKQEKNLETDFRKQSNGKYGRQSACKPCVQAAILAYRRTPKGKEKYREYAKRHREKEGYTEKHRSYRDSPKGKWSSYGRDAVRRGYVFEFSLEEFTDRFWQKPCFYCGAVNRTAGVDRQDNTQGYTAANCVPCCYTCNLMKLKASARDFIEKCKQVSERHTPKTT